MAKESRPPKRRARRARRAPTHDLISIGGVAIDHVDVVISQPSTAPVTREDMDVAAALLNTPSSVPRTIAIGGDAYGHVDVLVSNPSYTSADVDAAIAILRTPPRGTVSIAIGGNAIGHVGRLVRARPQ